jgi:hypothetical protein
MYSPAYLLFSVSALVIGGEHGPFDTWENFWSSFIYRCDVEILGLEGCSLCPPIFLFYFCSLYICHCSVMGTNFPPVPSHDPTQGLTLYSGSSYSSPISYMFLRKIVFSIFYDYFASMIFSNIFLKTIIYCLCKLDFWLNTCLKLAVNCTISNISSYMCFWMFY